ncbi:MAG: HAD family phosphatase [Clostridia bacterium]|nr:HAD family phosphatase [Clostridia bacterium]
MGAFENILICSDLDGTFIGDNLKIPKANIKAAEAFRKGGGKLTFATGRTGIGMKPYADIMKPDVPAICQNGAALYDCKKDGYIWISELSKDIAKLLQSMADKYKSTGIEVMTTLDVYCPRHNYLTRRHAADEDFVFKENALSDIPEPWLKAGFVDEKEIIDKIQTEIEASEYAADYTMERTMPIYYEIFAKNADKANAVLELSKITNTPLSQIIVLGDNDNDIPMLSMPCLSLCPPSSSERAKKSADIVLKTDNNDGILPEVLGWILKNDNI